MLNLNTKLAFWERSDGHGPGATLTGAPENSAKDPGRHMPTTGRPFHKSPPHLNAGFRRPSVDVKSLRNSPKTTDPQSIVGKHPSNQRGVVRVAKTPQKNIVEGGSMPHQRTREGCKEAAHAWT